MGDQNAQNVSVIANDGDSSDCGAVGRFTVVEYLILCLCVLVAMDIIYRYGRRMYGFVRCQRNAVPVEEQELVGNEEAAGNGENMHNVNLVSVILTPYIFIDCKRF